MSKTPQEQTIIKRLEQLEARNKRVEADKAWEGSWQRKILIILLTYIVVVCYLRFVVHIDPWINAFVPVIGFFLSTLSVSLAKQYWLKKRN